MSAILATIQESQTPKGYFISFHDDFIGAQGLRGIAPATFYLTEEHRLQDLRMNGELLNKLEWLKGAIEFVQMLQKHKLKREET